MTGEEIVARVLYRDALMLVIDKPAGFAVHKGPKGGESLEDHFGALRFGLPRAPALAHRLDRDTSGCLVLGRHRKALAELGRLFKAGRIGKTYWAVVAGGPSEEEGRIELPLGRKDATRGWWMKHDPAGQPAVTTWKVLGRAGVAMEPELAPASAAGVPSPACAGLSGELFTMPRCMLGQIDANRCFLVVETQKGRACAFAIASLDVFLNRSTDDSFRRLWTAWTPTPTTSRSRAGIIWWR